MRHVTSWADVEVESDEELNSKESCVELQRQDSDSLGSACGASAGGGYPANGEQMAAASLSGSDSGRRPKNVKMCNRALSKHELAASQPTVSGLQLPQHQGDEAPSLGASSMNGTPRSEATSGMGSTRSTSGEGTTEDSGTGESTQVGAYSVGAERHDVGGCKPCLFVHTHVGCGNGAACEFCHYLHKRKSKPRPCKTKRERHRKLLMRMEESNGVYVEESSDAGSADPGAASGGPSSGSGCPMPDDVTTIAHI